jgi:hypothetical protein
MEISVPQHPRAATVPTKRNIMQKEPQGFFQLEELEAFRQLEGEQLAEVNYYFWNHTAAANERFLLYIELLFQSDNALILTSGEDSEEIAMRDAKSLLEHGRTLMERNEGRPAMGQLTATASALWQPAQNLALEGVRLSKDAESGLYHNDALQFDFGAHKIVVALNERGGLAVVVA